MLDLNKMTLNDMLKEVDKPAENEKHKAQQKEMMQILIENENVFKEEFTFVKISEKNIDSIIEKIQRKEANINLIIPEEFDPNDFEEVIVLDGDEYFEADSYNFIEDIEDEGGLLESIEDINDEEKMKELKQNLLDEFYIFVY